MWVGRKSLLLRGDVLTCFALPVVVLEKTDRTKHPCLAYQLIINLKTYHDVYEYGYSDSWTPNAMFLAYTWRLAPL
jgi:hypothetical protein